MENRQFNPNNPGVGNGTYFGLPFGVEESALVLLSAPWEVTTSYGGGTAQGPDAILEASLQVDLYDVHHPGGWEKGIGTIEIDDTWMNRNTRLREEARKVILHLEAGGDPCEEYVQRKLRRVNEAGGQLNEYVYQQAAHWLSRGKKVGLVGGDHSVPLGLIRAVAERYPGVGVLHLDAHADLRDAYEGFTFSHASIMYNVLQQIPAVSALVQVGIRDFCDDELALAQAEARVSQFTDHDLSARRFEGTSWHTLCMQIVERLPQQVYVSFDIDALTPENCPHTGTPVPGGLTFPQAVYLLYQVVVSGREVVGFDLCEVAPAPLPITTPLSVSVPQPNTWDANVGARILYKLCNLTLL